MKSILLFFILFLGFKSNAQFKTLTLKTGDAYRYSKLYFVSSDTLYFRTKSSNTDCKVACSDVQSRYFLQQYQYKSFHGKNPNLTPLRVVKTAGVVLMVGGFVAGSVISYIYFEEIISALWIGIPCTLPGLLVYGGASSVLKLRKIHQNAILLQPGL